MMLRTRYLKTLLFDHPDKVPFEPGQPRETTLLRWQKEGLTDTDHWFEQLWDEAGITGEGPTVHAHSADVHFRMIPTFAEKVLEHRGGHYIVQDWMGNITEISDTYDFTYLRNPRDFVTRKWHRFPVENRHDFQAMKKRYNPNDPLRWPSPAEVSPRLGPDQEPFIWLQFSGVFWQLREWCGFEPLCRLLVDDPEFVQEMADFWMHFVLAVMDRSLATTAIDGLHISEDMAYKEKSMISPAMTRKVLQPAWSAWIDRAKQAGIRIFDMDSDGCIDELIPIWIEAGFNVCDPIEVAAGCDINRYRKRFGKAMAYRQGVDKRCMAAGGRAMEKELDRITPVVQDGGYIPGCDHGVPPDVSWPDFIHYARILARMTGWL